MTIKKTITLALAAGAAALAFAGTAHADIADTRSAWGETSYEEGINEFSDWTDEERSSLLTPEAQSRGLLDKVLGNRFDYALDEELR
ncbi:hypothetical protein [Streptomyces sp. NPDC058157]|uniref:hypothetical protein n=1 Tax=Streptomyces sp. NPDC058157 TaxID=3346360 RepID=UPI0036EA81D6